MRAQGAPLSPSASLSWPLLFSMGLVAVVMGPGVGLARASEGHQGTISQREAREDLQQLHELLHADQPWQMPPLEGLQPHYLRRGISTNFRHLRGQASPSPSLASWQRLKRKLSAGEPITVLGIGSSVLGVHGGCTGPAPEFLPTCKRCCFPRSTEPAAESTNGEMANFGSGWARIAFDYLVHRAANSTGAVATESRLINYARPGGSADAYNRCLSKWARGLETADLVLLELNIIGQDDQPWSNNHTAIEAEGLLRQLLSITPTPPALMFVNFYNWCKDIPAVCSYPDSSAPLKGLSALFTGSGSVDDAIQALGRHYEVPVLSHLHALWRLYFPGVDPKADADTPGGVLSPAFVGSGPTGSHTGDGIHPTPEGNKVFGPLCAFGLAEALAAAGHAHGGSPSRPRMDSGGQGVGALISPAGTGIGDASPSVLSIEPLFAPQYRDVPTGVCFDFIRPTIPHPDDGSERSGGQASQREKTEEYTLTPILYSRPAHISAARGFGYEELVKTGDGGERWKPGLFADSPGSFVDLSYHPPKTHLRPGTSACLTFIISHSRMGVAYLSCKGACQCKVMRINAFDAGAHTVERTECHTLMMEATEAGSNGAAAPPPAQNCTLHVEVTGKTSTGSHHFKITSLSFHNAQTVECRHGIC